MASIEKIKDLLSSGVAPAQVASACGTSAAYVYELLTDEDFKAEVSAKALLVLTEQRDRDRRVDAIEDKLIDRLSDAIDHKAFMKPSELLTAFRVVNFAKRRGIASNVDQTVNNVVVNLQLPTKIVQNFKINPSGEVIEANGQTLVTMPTHSLLKNLGDPKYDKVARYLPARDLSTDAEQQSD